MAWHNSLSIGELIALWTFILGVITLVVNLLKRTTVVSDSRVQIKTAPDEGGENNSAVNTGSGSQTVSQGNTYNGSVDQSTTTYNAPVDQSQHTHVGVSKEELNRMETVFSEQLKKKDGQIKEQDDLLKSAMAAINSLTCKLQEPDKSEAFKRRIQQALLEAGMGNTVRAEDLLSETLERQIAKGKDDYKRAAETACAKGALALMHDSQKSLKAYLLAIELDPECIEALRRAGRLYMRIDRDEDASEMFNTILNLARKKCDFSSESLALGNLGIIEKKNGRIKAAISLYQQALQIALDVQDYQSQLNQHANIANCWLIEKEYGKAEQSYLKALELCEHVVQKVELRGQLSSDLAGVYYLAGNPSKSLQYYSEAEKIIRSTDNTEGLATSLSNHGEVLISVGQRKDGFNKLKESIELFECLGIKREVTRVQTMFDELLNKDSDNGTEEND